MFSLTYIFSFQIDFLFISSYMCIFVNKSRKYSAKHCHFIFIMSQPDVLCLLLGFLPSTGCLRHVLSVGKGCCLDWNVKTASKLSSFNVILRNGHSTLTPNSTIPDLWTCCFIFPIAHVMISMFSMKEVLNSRPCGKH